HHSGMCASLLPHLYPAGALSPAVSLPLSLHDALPIYVGKFLEVIGVHADFIKFPAVVWHVVVRMAQFILRALGLQRDDFITGCVLNAHLGAVIVGKDVKNGGQGIAFLIGKVWGSTPLNQVSHWLCRDLNVI